MAPARSKAKSSKSKPRTDSKKPKAPPRASDEDRAAALQTALIAIEQQRWPLASVFELRVDDVVVRVTSSGPPGRWWLRTHGLFPSAPLELTLTMPRHKDDHRPPMWVEPVLQRLVGYARANQLTAGQVVRWDKPFGDAETDLAAFTLTLDARFGLVKTAHDEVPVLQAVGLTRDEVGLVREWSPAGLLEVLLKIDPTAATDLDRASLLASPRARQAIEQRVIREGSSMATLDAATSSLEGTTWRIDVETADAILSLLKGRIGHQRPFTVRSASSSVDVVPADAASFAVDGSHAVLKLTQPAARAMRSTLKAQPGAASWEAIPKLTLEVVSP